MMPRTGSNKTNIDFYHDPLLKQEFNINFNHLYIRMLNSFDFKSENNNGQQFIDATEKLCFQVNPARRNQRKC